jgi:hypothetical protein
MIASFRRAGFSENTRRLHGTNHCHLGPCLCASSSHTGPSATLRCRTRAGAYITGRPEGCRPGSGTLRGLIGSASARCDRVGTWVEQEPACRKTFEILTVWKAKIRSNRGVRYSQQVRSNKPLYLRTLQWRRGWDSCRERRAECESVEVKLTRSGHPQTDSCRGQ